MAFVDQNFTVWAGETKNINIVVEDSTGNPLDLTDIENAIWVLQKSILRDSPALIKTLDNGIEVVNAAEGLLRVKLEPADTEELAGYYYHEAELRDSFGNVSVILTGRALINPSATNI